MAKSGSPSPDFEALSKWRKGKEDDGGDGGRAMEMVMREGSQSEEGQAFSCFLWL